MFQHLEFRLRAVPLLDSKCQIHLQCMLGDLAFLVFKFNEDGTCCREKIPWLSHSNNIFLTTIKLVRIFGTDNFIIKETILEA